MTETIPEDQPLASDAPPPARPWQRWLLVVLVGGLALICLCAFAVGWSSVKVSPAKQQIAQQALLNPASAPLHLGQYGDIDGWRRASSSDYAVQDGMVIFPSATLSNLNPVPHVLGVRLSVLVYAPNGSDLSLRALPPDRGWFYGIGWFLYNCRPRLIDPLWWDCTLFVGGNI